VPPGDYGLGEVTAPFERESDSSPDCEGIADSHAWRAGDLIILVYFDHRGRACIRTKIYVQREDFFSHVLRRLLGL